MEKNNRIIIIGLSLLGLELVRKLSREYDITCIDVDPAASDKLASSKRDDVEFIAGDATSRLVLEEAGVNGADAVIITPTELKVSSEIARVLKDSFEPRRVFAVALSDAASKQLAELDVEVENVYASSALGIRNALEFKTKAASGIGIGKDEILEVEVNPNSRLANKPIGFLKPIRWRMGLVYRDGNILVPRADLVLKPRDRVVILGDPSVLKAVADVLTFSIDKFPLQYGSNALVYLCGRESMQDLEEIKYLFSVLTMERVTFICAEKTNTVKFREMLGIFDFKGAEIKNTSLPPLSAIKDSLMSGGRRIGLMLFTSAFFDHYGPSPFGLRKKAFLSDVIAATKCPVIVARGTFPYERMLVPATAEVDMEYALDTGLQVASSFSCAVTALQVNPSEYIASQDEMDSFESDEQIIHNLAIIYKAKVEDRIVEGNPIKDVVSTSSGFNLMVLDYGGRRSASVLKSFFSPDVEWEVLRRSRITTLLLPQHEKGI